MRLFMLRIFLISIHHRLVLSRAFFYRENIEKLKKKKLDGLETLL